MSRFRSSDRQQDAGDGDHEIVVRSVDLNEENVQSTIDSSTSSSTGTYSQVSAFIIFFFPACGGLLFVILELQVLCFLSCRMLTIQECVGIR